MWIQCPKTRKCKLILFKNLIVNKYAGGLAYNFIDTY